MSTIRRQDRGLGKTPAGGSGGSYAAHDRQVAPPPPSISWGVVNLSEGSRTPWGPAQQVEHLAPGIAVVHTAGHGGVKLSPERNREVPEPLRQSSGWYEEDCEFYIPAHTFPGEEMWRISKERAAEGVREWFPDGWEASTGEKVTAEQSSIIAEREFLKANEGKLIATSASKSKVSPDHVLVSARSDGGWVDFLVLRDEYKEAGTRYGFVIDEARHPRVESAPADPGPEYVHISSADIDARLANPRLSESARSRITSELEQKWRSAQTGEVYTLQEVLQDGVLERNVYVENSGRRNFAIIGKNSFSYRVSKATWDFLSEVPDGRTAADRTYQEVRVLRARLEKATRGTPEARQLKEKVSELVEVAERLREEERAADLAKNGTFEERTARSDAAQAERERAALEAFKARTN